METTPIQISSEHGGMTEAVPQVAPDSPEAAAEYNRMIAELRILQSRIEDKCAVAAAEIKKITARYWFKLNLYKPWLKEYTKSQCEKRIKVNPETGETKIPKSYKSIEAGGGGYFRTAKGCVTIAPHVIEHCVLEGLFPECFVKRTVSDVLNPEELARKILEKNPELGAHIVIVDDDPWGNFSIGATKAWSPSAAAEKLTAAIKESKDASEVTSEDDNQD